MPRNAPELPEGLNLLDRYTIVDHIGGGGMADIYRAHDSRLDRIVCVKLLRNVIEGSGSTSGGVVYQATYTHFLQEARALSKLAHPNTLRIYDFGFLQLDSDDTSQAQPRPFQITEFLDGGNLETYVRARGTLKPVEVLAILDRIAGAVGEAHEVGIIHRDIKPSNILFSRVGDVLMPKLADFGIARGLRRYHKHGGDSEETLQIVPPVPLFSPRWAAPEQLSATEEGGFTDVYGLALVIGFMLSGRSLFDVPDVNATFGERVQGDQYVRSRLALQAFAPEVARVLMNGLRADRRARTQSPFELYEALSQAFGTPRTSLPLPIAHSGGVPQARAPQDSISVQASFVPKEKRALSIEPPEQLLKVGGRDVRLVETHEKLDLTVQRGEGGEVRLRVTLLPARGPQFRVNLKGLSCFIRRPGGSASPALATDTDGTAELVSSKQETLGVISWSFGTIRGPARVFPVARGELVVPFPQGECALAVELGSEREVIVICRHP
ncbi:MAG TPA: serine/threonine-protein kinase [Polyangiaceae bacterium]